MKKTILSALMLTTFFAAAQAQTVMEDSYSRLSVSFSTPDVVLDAKALGDSKYTTPNLDGYILGGTVGSPALPVLSNLIVVPFCSDMKVSVTNAVYDTLQFEGGNLWMPLQPSRSKSDFGPLQVQLNEQVYSTDAFVSMPLAQVEEVGIARDRRIARLVFSPVSVNPVTGQYIVCRKADVTVSYVNADSAATEEYFQRYFTPAFSIGSTLNSLVDTKSVRTDAPVRMVVVCPTSLNCAAVNNFVKWKKRQGYIVDRVNYGTGAFSTNTALANYLKELYTNASTEAPAPTYVVLIGDHEQLPAFDGTVNTSDIAHVTDLNFVSWTPSDNVPDCYQGRLSATSGTAVANVINKILLYEQYGFADDSYLAKGILVSGVADGQVGDQGYEYCDPSMDYVARFYVNSNNGFNNVSYYKNNTNFNPDASVVTITGSCQSSTATSELRSLYNAGAGLVNYTAHGFWDSWYLPELTVSMVNSMSNTGKPMFVIGNCCLTNKFDEYTCLGEAFIRRSNNAGAAAYIGATNSTYWTEDFYWTVGVRPAIYGTMNTNYNASKLGVYDRLFHTHGESFSNYAVTAGAMVFYGNMSVQNASVSSTTKKYYWEIYELMGDPSMMPWLGQAQELSGFSASSEVTSSGCNVNISAVPYAYIALRDTVNNVLLGAAFADADGNAVISVDDCEALSGTLISVSAQGYKPFFYADSSLDINNVSTDQHINVYPNPATSQCTVAADGIQSIRLLDSRGSLIATYAPAADSCTIDLTELPSGVYFVQVQTPGNLLARKLIVK